jgi:hypothetical protein
MADGWTAVCFAGAVTACPAWVACGSPGAGGATMDAAAVDVRSQVDAAEATSPRLDGGIDAADDVVLPVVPGDAAPAPVAFLRFANWSPDAPAVDFCIATHPGGSFMGPLAQAAADGGATATTSNGDVVSLLSFPLLGAYVAVPPGTYDVRVVVAGAGSCGAGIGHDSTLPALAAATFSTAALVGEELPSGGDPGLEVVAFRDDFTPTGTIGLRFIQAAPAVVQADLGTGRVSVLNFKPLFQNVAFGTASTVAALPAASTNVVDTNGYEGVSAFSNATLSAHVTGATVDTVSTTGMNAAAGSVVTIALIGKTSSGGAAGLLECVDNAGLVGPLSDCMLLP